ncbi:secretion protein [Burkholderia ubonensis]|uniref:secretion protein n=1 Tax=Burkholderia ubonensis TaxID=101571 RepID=UPI00075228B9|nr:secretion protein [Burkholderia ubonensis]KWN63611.1 secretion protein [Burkholderia ubonensis]
MQPDAIDAVTRYLRAQGFDPQPAYFGESGFRVGWRLRINDLELVYRLDKGSLIVCDLVAKERSQGASNAVATFIHLVHRIERSGVPVQEVCGMFIETASDPELNRVRRRLALVLEAQGACWQEIDGEPWLLYPIGATSF